MLYKYKIGTLVYSAHGFLGMIVGIYENRYIKSKYIVEWSGREFYGAYTEYEIEELIENLNKKIDK